MWDYMHLKRNMSEDRDQVLSNMKGEMNTIERLIPESVIPDDITGQSTLSLHLQRYEFAAKHVKGKRLLDIACGVGYGTRLMVDKVNTINKALGVDLSHDAVVYALRHYGNERVRFLEQDAMTFTDEEGFDSIVSVETLEHVSEPAMLAKRLIGLLRPGGVFIASVPTTPSMDVNPFHSHDFTEASFRDMVAVHGMREIACLKQIQPYPLIKTVKREESRMKDMRQDLISYYLNQPAALIKRLWATLRYGFTNRYITIVWLKET
jgi:2-polyprenyl-3-methyl-5-hydroxy-6-metoxy-1,4-benzoquinol methylase